MARGLDQNTMGLQYLEMMKQLATSEGSKWIVPTELTRFLSTFNRGGDGASAEQR